MSKKRKQKQILTNSNPQPLEKRNGFANLTESLVGNTNQLSSLDTLINNNRYYHIFNNRMLLSSLYIEHGLIQTLIDQPVDDAFRGGIKIKSKQLNENDISELENYLTTNDIISKIAQTIKWGRLFGGSGLVIMTSQPNDKEFSLNKINKYSSLDFYSADLWELNLAYYQQNPLEILDDSLPYNFYGVPLHTSRVLKFVNKQAPSLLRRKFRGWGMSEVERLVRSFNQYLKNNDVIFDLLDEAKVDVYKLENLNFSLLSNQEQSIKDRVRLSNMLCS